MVKIPGLDDLKKMGNDLIDSAKTVKLGGMVDKIKGGMESVGIKRDTTTLAAGGDPLAQMVQDANATFAELMTVQAQQAQLIKKLQNQLTEMSRVVGTYQKPAQPEIKEEEDKKS